MRVLFLAPNFPAEMPHFSQGLAEVGATVVGVGQHPKEALPEKCRRALSNYLRVTSIMDEERTYQEVLSEIKKVGAGFDRVETLWEPLVMLAARLREKLGCPGMRPHQAVAFRDKEEMKRRLDAAGIRTPRHARAESADEMRAAAEKIGYPLIVKPIAGAGSADTYRVDDRQRLEQVITLVQHVPVASSTCLYFQGVLTFF